MTVYDFTPKVDSVDTIYAADINELQSAIEEISARSGGGTTFPMNPNIWYDNGTAFAVEYDSGTVTLEPDVVQAALIQITDPDANLTTVGIYQASEPASESTVRLALYAPSETGTGRGLPGAKIADLGTVAVVDDFDIYSVSPDVAVSPGYYWIVASADVAFDVKAVGTNSTNILGTDDGNSDYAGVSGASVGAEAAMPSTLNGAFDLDSRESDALYVLFKVTPN